MTSSLYDLSVSSVISCYQTLKKINDLAMLPNNILFDIYYMLYSKEKLCELGIEFSDLNTFTRMLKVTNKRIQLLRSFQAVIDHGKHVHKTLTMNYLLRRTFETQNKISFINLGIRLGGFLSEAGWFAESERVLSECLNVCLELPPSVEAWRYTLQCCHKLLYAQAIFSMVQKSQMTQKLAEELVEKLKAQGQTINLASLYTLFSFSAYCMSNYDESYRWSVEAIKQLDAGVSARITIDTMCQASRACVLKREFTKAGILVRQAVSLARDTFGKEHLRFADTLHDYGFYLMNSDSIKDSVRVYETALNLKKAVFGPNNLHVAIAQEDMAYALYVHEYSSGHFAIARDQAEKAISTMTALLPPDHLMLAAAQRVKALILEEIALDSEPGTDYPEAGLLNEAESLHKNALKLSISVYGEYNVQTAKHYGNLGRLYQSMKKFEEAEMMHLKAIAIKEKLLGMEDYEVGLSVGHLASLYNYHMKQFRKAEQLYFRSISINIKLFSETYSGLEYDYRGLIHVYEKMGETEKQADYTLILSAWKDLREHLKEAQPLVIAELQPLEEIKKIFA
ncbi:amyloid protein-binding protein 2 [Nilaparvata lugens]|uniref:amyloid protein-binding protein 2 n=1 Tax=Nilaparvata lugens TaxID=108931 RepID=UPI00193DFB69|nr:amyloid protein-binding protein 2 [Nilaparvata lugens]